MVVRECRCGRFYNWWEVYEGVWCVWWVFGYGLVCNVLMLFMNK